MTSKQFWKIQVLRREINRLTALPDLGPSDPRREERKQLIAKMTAQLESEMKAAQLRRMRIAATRHNNRRAFSMGPARSAPHARPTDRLSIIPKRHQNQDYIPPRRLGGLHPSNLKSQ